MRKGRIDWSSVKACIDLVAVVSAHLGPAQKRGSGRLWWVCPFHPDRNPSFCVTAGRSEWHCFGCGARGDAAALVMRLKRLTFPEAARRLSGDWLGQPVAGGRWPVVRGDHDRTSPTAGHLSPTTLKGLSLSEAEALVADGQEHLWAPEGAAYLRCLHRRGLSDPTIRAAGLGWTPRVMIPRRDGQGCYPVCGVVIPWLEGVRLTLVKIRQPEGREPKYVEAFRDNPRLYPSTSVVRPGAPLIVTEGEFDTLLLGQELADLASVVTLGSASTRLAPEILWTIAGAGPIYTAHDADRAGELAASAWPARAQRARPPAPDKDWTEANRSGVNLLRWWRDRLAGIETPERFNAEEEAQQERAAIMEFDGGLSRNAAELAAGLERRREPSPWLDAPEPSENRGSLLDSTQANG
jgi:hypothetical protein